MSSIGRLIIVSAVVAATNGAAAEEVKPTIAAAELDINGFLVHSVQSPYQAGVTKIRVLLPDRFDRRKKYRVLFVLPVEAQDGERYGNGLVEVKKAGLHNQHELICVAPTFSHLPWYADHPTDKSIRQESYLLKVVLPFVDKQYPTTGTPEGRLLVGFSKSGWGAWSLLLRHPDVFGKAAAWDAPLMQKQPNRFGMGPIFGTNDNFKKYEITALLKQHADLLKKSNRLALTGFGGFRRDHLQAQNLMQTLGVKCEYRDGPQRKHRWDTGWLPETVGLIISK